VALAISASVDVVAAAGPALAQALMTLVVGACAVRPDHGLVWLTDPAPVRWIGTVSYGVYLFHVALITGARRVLPEALTTPAWTFVVVLPVTIAAASASYRWVEEPLLRLRARFPRGARRA
jgi:peptidoglycan/LPS O-acetylase OafA/YrhL